MEPLLLVNLEEIPPEGLDLPLKLSPEQLSRLVVGPQEDPPKILGDLTGKLKIFKLDGRLKLQGGFEVEVSLPCDRCLAETAALLSGRVDELLALSGGSYAPAAGEEDDSDGSLPVLGSQVDLSGLLAEFFWLAWPFRFICRKDCAGLCPSCGADLNQGPCPCRKSEWN